MTTEHAAKGLIGASIRRVEDAPLITGKGYYTEDIQLPGMLHLVFLRSPYPHAKLMSIDASAAKAMAGVIAVVTGDELSERLHVPAFPMVPGMKIPPHPLLARGAVHAVGTPVAVVVAQSRALAQDAASTIVVEYEALPAVVNAEKALDPVHRAPGRSWKATCVTSRAKKAAMSTKHSPRPSISFDCVSPAQGWWHWRWSREAS